MQDLNRIFDLWVSGVCVFLPLNMLVYSRWRGLRVTYQNPLCFNPKMVWTKKGVAKRRSLRASLPTWICENLPPPKKWDFTYFHGWKIRCWPDPFRKVVFVWIAVKFGRKIYRIWSCLFGGGVLFFEYNSLSYHITKYGEYDCYFDLTGFIELL